MMAATVNSNAGTTLSPHAPVGEAGGPHSPPRQASPPPWNQITPYNATLDSGVVMGAVSWPSLSESTNVSSNTTDAPISQAIASSGFFSPASPQKKVNINPNKPNPNPDLKRLARQKSMSRDNGGSSSSDGGFSQSSSIGDSVHANNNFSKMNTGGSDSSGKDHRPNNANREDAQRSGGGLPQQFNYRRSNSNHVRRDNDWSHRRSFNGRDSVMPAQRVSPNAFIRPPPPPPGANSYFPPPAPLPYGSLMGIPPEMQHLYYFPPPLPGMPVLAPMPPPVYYLSMDHQLHAKIINQIDYYFSNDNLIKDTYLRKNMDENGWVPIQLIANFKKVTELTTDTQLILDALQASTAVEVQGDKIRRRGDWIRWLMPSSAQFDTTGSQHSPRMLPDILPAQLQGLTLQEKQA